ncbi:hypothetical protein GPECTOR_2g1472 [Gonium pectorale]|uniref:FAS1 domain-containing protein n=1 Tax=Gonium pectorale TaxID=33097 RepID=A0A150H1F4_GONPE|nr:hypothetical protein GPECTOR_2g1472 [Gonium pectorale]|eukprot:KXZ55921.1 hypothetical protein GPECTOR_2g1472 [Gonium pectorale]
MIKKAADVLSLAAKCKGLTFLVGILEAAPPQLASDMLTCAAKCTGKKRTLFLPADQAWKQYLSLYNTTAAKITENTEAAQAALTQLLRNHALAVSLDPADLGAGAGNRNETTLANTPQTPFQLTVSRSSAGTISVVGAFAAATVIAEGLSIQGSQPFELTPCTIDADCEYGTCSFANDGCSSRVIKACESFCSLRGPDYCYPFNHTVCAASGRICARHQWTPDGCGNPGGGDFACRACPPPPLQLCGGVGQSCPAGTLCTENDFLCPLWAPDLPTRLLNDPGINVTYTTMCTPCDRPVTPCSGPGRSACPTGQTCDYRRPLLCNYSAAGELPAAAWMCMPCQGAKLCDPRDSPATCGPNEACAWGSAICGGAGTPLSSASTMACVTCGANVTLCPPHNPNTCGFNQLCANATLNCRVVGGISANATTDMPACLTPVGGERLCRPGDAAACPSGQACQAREAVGLGLRAGGPVLTTVPAGVCVETAVPPAPVTYTYTRCRAATAGVFCSPEQVCVPQQLSTFNATTGERGLGYVDVCAACGLSNATACDGTSAGNACGPNTICRTVETPCLVGNNPEPVRSSVSACLPCGPSPACGVAEGQQCAAGGRCTTVDDLQCAAGASLPRTTACLSCEAGATLCTLGSAGAGGGSSECSPGSKCLMDGLVCSVAGGPMGRRQVAACTRCDRSPTFCDMDSKGDPNAVCPAGGSFACARASEACGAMRLTAKVVDVCADCRLESSSWTPCRNSKDCAAEYSNGAKPYCDMDTVQCRYAPGAPYRPTKVMRCLSQEEYDELHG